jgi:hypothetical protein
LSELALNKLVCASHADRLLWGEETLWLPFSFANIKLSGLSSLQRELISEYFCHYLDKPNLDFSIPKIDLECFTYRLKSYPAVSMQSLTVDSLYTPRKVRHNNLIEITGADFEAQILLDQPGATAYLGVVDELDIASAGVIENFLRPFAAHNALRQGGVLLHSAGLVFNGQAYIFVGRSGAGKTTLARKAYAGGARVLSDDINVLLPNCSGFRALSVPFTGEFGRTMEYLQDQTSYPISSVALLSQGENLRVNPACKSEATSRLLTGSPFVNTDQEETEDLFDVLEELVERVPIFRITCNKSDSIEDIMRTFHTRS